MKKKNKRKIENRGRPITCKYCDHKFKVIGKIRRKRWFDKKFPCPKCKILYCFLTETEKNLQTVQEKYKSTKDRKYLDEICIILLPYAESIIKKHYINLINDKSLLKYYAESAVSLLIESDFLKRENFIEISFGSRLQKKCIQAIMGVKESIERHSPDDSFDYMLEDGHTVVYEDTKKSLLESIEYDEEKFLLCKNICSILFKLEEFCESRRENYVRLLNIYNYLEGGEQAIDRFFEIYGRYGKYKTMQSLNILKNELQKS